MRYLLTKWEPFPYQRTLIESGPGIDLVIGGVGAGKTQPAAFKFLAWALKHPWKKDGQPTRWLCLAPDYQFIKANQFASVLMHAGLLNAPVVRNVVYGTNPRIELAHGQTIFGRSGTDPDRLRGLEIDGFWMEEAEYQTDKAFTMGLARQRSSDCIRAIVTTTPENVRRSWLWPIIEGKSDAHRGLRPIKIYRWKTSDNPSNSTDVRRAVAAAVELATPGGERQELEGLFLGSHEAPMPGAFDLRQALIGDVELAREDMHPVIGVDLGRSHDFTVFVVLGAHGHVLGIDRFNAGDVNKEAKAGFYAYAADRLRSLCSQSKPRLVKLDTAMHGASFAEMCRERVTPLRVEGYRTDSPKRKAEAMEALGVALSQGRIKIPKRWRFEGEWHNVQREILLNELEELVVEERAGYRTYDHPQDGHDDCVVALALAWQGVIQAPARPQTNALQALQRASLPARPSLSGGGGGGGYVF